MMQDCWQLWEDRGLLIKPDPLVHVPGLPDEIDMIAADLPSLLETHQLRSTLDRLTIFDPTTIISEDFALVERLMQIYSYFASAYVYATDQEPSSRIPAGVAVPLVKLATLVQRPPILSYSGYVLNNWRRIDPAGEIVLENIETIQHFRGGRDEDWFILVHVDIEARAARALWGIQQAAEVALRHDTNTLTASLQDVATGLADMITTFNRMPENCDTDIYYWKVRPYIFGFTDVVYEGVYNNQPQSFRGQTGAQSSIIPTLVAGLGIQHESSGLTQHLDIMKSYMPLPHRELIAQMAHSQIRQAVQQSTDRYLHDVYNECLRRLMEFRRLHLHYATIYIFDKVKNPVGTGGTIFMDWLAQLVNETEAHLV